MLSKRDNFSPDRLYDKFIYFVLSMYLKSLVMEFITYIIKFQQFYYPGGFDIESKLINF